MKTDALIVGAGAIGSFLALRLDEAGYKVGLLARGRRAEVLKRDGITLLTEGGDRVCRAVPVSTAVEDFLPAKVVFVCTKTGAVANVAESLHGKLDAGTIVVTVQNGVEAPGQVHDALPEVEVVAARLHGFYEMEGDTVRHVGVAPSYALGPVAGARESAADTVAAMLTRSGIEISRPGDVIADLWRKFLLASSVGAVALALDRRVGAIMIDEEGGDLLRDAMEEVAALALNRGVTLGPDCVADTLAFVQSFPPEATSSLQRDVEAGGPSEYDALIGAVPRLAHPVGMETPIFDRLETLIAQRGLGSR